MTPGVFTATDDWLLVRLASLALCLLVLLAGCSFGATPNPEPGPAEPLQLNVTNEGSASVAVSVGIVDRDVDRVRLTYTNGTARTVGVPADGIARFFSATNVSAVRPVASQEIVGEYTVAPGNAIQTGLAAPPAGGSVFFTVRGAGGDVDHWGVATCPERERLHAVGFFVDASGVGMSAGCSP